MEFEKVRVDKNTFYWTWKDLSYWPYAWLDKKDLKNLPKPFYLAEIHPDCPVGFETDEKAEFTNIIKLPDSFEKLKIDNDLKKDLKRVIAKLPALKKPTISGLSDDGWFAVETIIDERIVRQIIPGLKQAGAQGIIEYPLNKVIY